MTDAQFGLLLGALGTIGTGIAAVLRWAVGRITKAIDDNTASNIRLSDAQIEYAKSISSMSARIDHVADWVHAHTPVPTSAPASEHDAGGDIPAPRPPNKPRRRTFPLGHVTPKPGRDE